MPDIIKLRRSSATGAVPPSLHDGELAINIADGKIFYKDGDNAIVEFAGGGGGGFSWASAPASPTASGSAGDIAYDTNYIYVATGSSTWKRAPLSTWSPVQDIAGLQLWLDASDATTLYDATSGGSLVAADGTVKRWEDKSGNGRHATEATYGPTRKTSQQNGLAALLFNGTNNFLSGSSTPSTGNARTVFAVTKSADTAGNDFFQIGTFQDTNSRLFSLRQSYGSSNTGISSDMVATNIYVASTQLTINAYHISCWRQTSSTRAISYWHNGVSQTVTGTPGSFSAGAGYFVGKGRTSEDSGFWNGYIAEVAIFDSELSDSNRSLVENYLISKWGLA